MDNDEKHIGVDEERFRQRIELERRRLAAKNINRLIEEWREERRIFTLGASRSFKDFIRRKLLIESTIKLGERGIAGCALLDYTAFLVRVNGLVTRILLSAPVYRKREDIEGIFNRCWDFVMESEGLRPNVNPNIINDLKPWLLNYYLSLDQLYGEFKKYKSILRGLTGRA
ncbi:MAG: hypothetical protein QW619_05940 [Candidatus Bathyarchaeia archaeon]